VRRSDRLYEDAGRFRSTSTWRATGSASASTEYFSRPLPPLVEALRRQAYPALAAIANRWEAALSKTPLVHPPTLDELLAVCRREADQADPCSCATRPALQLPATDIYGDVVFSVQITCS